LRFIRASNVGAPTRVQVLTRASVWPTALAAWAETGAFAAPSPRQSARSPSFCGSLGRSHSFGERMSRNYRVVRGVQDDSGMALNVIGCDRDQSFLMPPGVRDWLPEGHLAWFVLDAVAGMNLGEFYAASRSDGVGRRAYDPAMMA
jgi:hypothetical protein